ncbi:uncharacterized protein LOC121849486 [Callorhinchus milii]|uniref:uncharacterized protein LOC121849486 n=1 Tax=Callorhinchus milii TaxID=7868 RepID=UPI001C3FD961|nr:uncharacterized protein LOC121849486 [Callorhinchus milii]
MTTNAPAYSSGQGKYGKEDLFSKSHLRSMENGSSYLSISDSSLLSVASYKPWGQAEFHFTKLFHATNFQGVKDILERQRFYVKSKKIIEKKEMYFSWWSVAIGKDMIIEERERQRNVLSNAGIGVNRLPDQFLNSPAFQDQSRYGNYKFTYDITTLIAEYKNAMCPGNTTEISVLGTFQYKCENMHAVVVHAPGEPTFEDFPRIQNNSYVVSKTLEGNWIWSPDSITSKIPQQLLRCTNNVFVLGELELRFLSAQRESRIQATRPCLTSFILWDRSTKPLQG